METLDVVEEVEEAVVEEVVAEAAAEDAVAAVVVAQVAAEELGTLIEEVISFQPLNLVAQKLQVREDVEW